MKQLSLLQKIAVYTGLIGAITFGGYNCGPEDTQNPEQDAQVEVDGGNSKDYGNTNNDGGNLEDKINIEDTFDGGSKDVPNGDYEPADSDSDTYVPTDGGDLTDVPYTDGGDVNVTDGGQDAGGNVGPVVVIEAKDDQGNVKSEFNVDEWVTYDLNKSYDPDCSDKGTCGSSKGIDYCKFNDSLGLSGFITFPTTGTGYKKLRYNIPHDTVTLTVKCYDLDDKLESTNAVNITVK